MRPLPRRRYPELEGLTLLVGVGAMRAGTSWTAGYLGSLPGVAVTPVKELHFFNARFRRDLLVPPEAAALAELRHRLAGPPDDPAALLAEPQFRAALDRARMVHDDDAYFAHLAGLVGPETRVVAEVTPAYAVIGREGFAWMRAAAEAQGLRLRVVFILRDPVERLWSQLRYLPQLDAAIRIPEDCAALLGQSRVIARANYRRTVEDLDAALAPDEVLYLFQEELSDPAELARLAGFAGVAPGPADHLPRRNAARDRSALPEGLAARFMRWLAPQYAFCRKRFGDRIPDAWRA